MLVLSLWIIPIFVFILFALRQSRNKSSAQDSTVFAVEIHKEKLAALKVQFENGELSDEEFDSFTVEEEKAILSDANFVKQNEATDSQLPWFWIPALTVFIFIVSFGLYLKLGAYEAVDVKSKFQVLANSENVGDAEIVDALSSYQKLLESSPDDLEGWFRLSGMQREMEQFDAALISLNKTLTLLREVEHNAEDEAAVLSYIGQVQFSLNNPELALEAFESSLEYSAQNSTALGMAGRMQFELGDYAKAIEYWTRLKLLNPGADETVIDDFINNAKAQLALQGIDYEEQQPVHIIVNIELPSAWEGLPASAALFVYARPEGSKMPLAVKRLPVTAQAFSVMLSDADAMGPMGGISSQERVEVTARVSLTGIANSQPGDWAVDAVLVELSEKKNVVSLELFIP